MNKFTYDYYKASADYILERISRRPRIGIILGSALGSLADDLENPTEIYYKDIPNFLEATVKSHAGKFVFGKLNGEYVALMAGRFHYYEGYDFEELAAPIRVLKLIGVDTTIVTNAAGAINTSYRVGDVMIISDHIKLMGASPMRGENVDEFGPRFFDVSYMYTPALRKLALDCGARVGQQSRIHEGVYFYFPGPQFETPAEIRAAGILGGDAVGMSTVTESLAAAHCGMKLLGLSLITNTAAGVEDKAVTGEEVSRTGREAAGRFSELIGEIVKAMRNREEK